MRARAGQPQTFTERLGASLDRFVGLFSPTAQLRRLAARQSISALSGGYVGGKRDRLKENWLPGGASADADLLPDLPALRERSRDLVRNDSVASAVVQVLVSHAVGRGLTPQCTIEDDTLQETTERIWRDWCATADAGNRMTFEEITCLALQQVLENGETLVMPTRVEDREYPLALEVIEGDKLSTPEGKTEDARLRGGVELGSRGEPLAYWIEEDHPGDFVFAPRAVKRRWRRVPAQVQGRPGMLHLYEVKRPGQTRGVPLLAPVLDRFHFLGKYLEAELVAARVNACLAVAITKEDPWGARTAASTSTTSQGQRLQELEPGMIEYLAPGESIEVINPNRPNSALDAFVTRLLRDIGAALGIPYELLAADYSKTNYSSARAALLQGWNTFRRWQDWLAKRLCTPVWRMLMEDAQLAGELPAKLTPADLRAVRWIGPDMGWVDPTKEVEASQMAITAGLSTLADECSSRGRDWQDVLLQRKREQDMAEELGVEIGEPKPEPPVPPGQEPGEEETDAA